MYSRLIVQMCSMSLVVAAVGCAASPGEEAEGRVDQAVTSCGVGGDVLSNVRLRPDAIPRLTTLERSQIIAAVQESAHTDVTTVEQAFGRVDQQEIRRLVLRDASTGQVLHRYDYGAGDNEFGAIFFAGTMRRAAAIHDGEQVECGPVTFNVAQNDIAPECTGLLTYANATELAALDAFLPSQVAQAIVATRAVASFDSIAAVVGVAGVGDARLLQLLGAADDAGLILPTCRGIFDRIGFSNFEDAALAEAINELDAAQLRDILSFLSNQTVVDNLIARQPFANVEQISATPGVGTEVLRALRNFAGDE